MFLLALYLSRSRAQVVKNLGVRSGSDNQEQTKRAQRSAAYTLLIYRYPKSIVGSAILDWVTILEKGVTSRRHFSRV